MMDSFNGRCAAALVHRNAQVLGNGSSIQAKTTPAWFGILIGWNGHASCATLTIGGPYRYFVEFVDVVLPEIPTLFPTSPYGLRVAS
jgi:hypothetical protein